MQVVTRDRSFWRYNAHLVAAYLGAFVLMTMAVSQCGCNVSTLYKSTASLAVVASAGYKALDAQDAQKQTEIRAKAVSDQAGARLDFAAWMSTYNAARKALNVAEDTVEAAMHAIPTISDLNVKDAQKWIALLATAALDLAKALSDAGVKLPAGLVK